MKLQDIIEALESKPLTVSCEAVADWVFTSLPEQYTFIMQMVALLEAKGYELSDPPEGDGEVQRIDYLYLKKYEGFELIVYWDFKVQLLVFHY